MALSGWTGPTGGDKNIYVFDRTSGRVLGRNGGLPDAVLHLAFSPDGRRLAAGLGGRNGIRLYAADPPWRELGRDADYGDASYSVDFDRRGRLVATSLDGKLRLYDEHLKPLVAPRTVPGGEHPFFARFSPDGRRIAVGFDDSTAVSVVSGEDLKLRYPVDTRGAGNGNLDSVAWSPDGETLYAAGKNRLDDGQLPVRAWPQQGRGPMQTWPVATNTVVDLRPMADGRLVYAAGNPAWGVLDARGQRLVQQSPPILDNRGNYDEFRLSAAGDVVELEQVTWREGRRQESRARFDLAARRLERGVTPLAGLHAPRIEGLNVTDWKDTNHPGLAGQPLALSQYEHSRSLAASPDAQRFALGTEWAVYLFDHKGHRLWRKPTPGVAWLVNLSADGRFVVAALGDGSLRWYRTDDEGSEALALFVHADGERWVLWTPRASTTPPPAPTTSSATTSTRDATRRASSSPPGGSRSNFIGPTSSPGAWPVTKRPSRRPCARWVTCARCSPPGYGPRSRCSPTRRPRARASTSSSSRSRRAVVGWGRSRSASTVRRSRAAPARPRAACSASACPWRRDATSSPPRSTTAPTSRPPSPCRRWSPWSRPGSSRRCMCSRSA